MPELYDSMPTSPRINVFYLAPEQEIISPEQVESSGLDFIVTGSGSHFAKISPSMLVKYGSHTSLIEAKTMLFVAEHTSLPVPKLYAAYAYGPLDRDVGDYGSVYDTYIFMEFIEGEDLGKSWETFNAIEKQQISADLKSHMTELRSLPAATYIGSVHGRPVTDIIFEWSTTSKGKRTPFLCSQCDSRSVLNMLQGPFSSVQDFNATIADTFAAQSKTHVGPYIRGILDAHHHGIVFTHGDLRPPNVIVRNGRVAAIIDWELAGWYPDYWEFAKAFFIEHFVTDWGTHLLDVLTPYYCEQLMHARLMSVLW